MPKTRTSHPGRACLQRIRPLKPGSRSDIERPAVLTSIKQGPFRGMEQPEFAGLPESSRPP